MVTRTLTPNPALPPPALAVLETVSQAEGVSVADILGRCRRPELVRARWRAWSALRTMPWGAGRPSYPRIGAWLGRDHTTILHGVRRYEGAR